MLRTSKCLLVAAMLATMFVGSGSAAQASGAPAAVVGAAPSAVASATTPIEQVKAAYSAVCETSAVLTVSGAKPGAEYYIQEARSGINSSVRPVLGGMWFSDFGTANKAGIVKFLIPLADSPALDYLSFEVYRYGKVAPVGSGALQRKCGTISLETSLDNGKVTSVVRNSGNHPRAVKLTMVSGGTIQVASVIVPPRGAARLVRTVPKGGTVVVAEPVRSNQPAIVVPAAVG